jgi:8-oxo-dGTP pyrophosphatase MutT (NUDIX family)
MEPYKARAVVFSDDGTKVLLIHRQKNGQEYWVFPGGSGEEKDATEAECVIRECLEELGVTVVIDEPLFVVRDTPVPEFFFRCSIVAGVVGTGTGPEFQRDPSISGTYTPKYVAIADIGPMKVVPPDAKSYVLQRTQ